MANEAKQFTIGGVTHDVMDVGARQLITQLQAAIDAITSGDTTTAIKTFQEVINFLDGVTDDATLIGKLNELRTLIAAKYSKPASGIPASDLADGVIPDVSGFATKTEVNAKANSADVYTKTEVDDKVAEAGKVKSVSVNNGTPAQPDGNGNVNIQVQTGSTISPATVAPSMDGTAAVGSSAKYAREDHVHPKDTSKQDKLTFDNVPTAGSNNPVKSGGIKTAIDQVTPTIDANGKWVIGGVATDKDAQGPRGNSILVNENAQSIQALIVNNVVDGGETDILSAEMGKVIRQNIMKIFNALGNYAFPNGKPTIDWGDDTPVTFTVSKTIGTGLSATGGDTDVEMGDSLEVTIAITDNLYVIDDDSVVVTMGGQPVAGAWNASTMKVTIAAVTGDVVINVPSLTYVGYGEQNSPLAFMLDCKNRGSQSGHWIDLIGNIDFTLGSAVTAADSGVAFDGSTNSYGETNSALTIAPSAGTIEAVVVGASGEYNPILINPVASGDNDNIGLCIYNYSNVLKIATMSMRYPGSNGPTVNCSADTGSVTDFALSLNNQKYMNNGVGSAPGTKYSFLMNTAHTKLTLGRSRRPASDSRGDVVFVGTIKAIRVYNSVLTEAQQLQNWKVDQKRFNVS